MSPPDEYAAYGWVHADLKAERGPASNYPCADCGEPASDWSFDRHTGYSWDLSRYAPRCKPCHTRRDARGRRRARERRAAAEGNAKALQTG